MYVKVGTAYSDPEGEWEVTEINGYKVTVQQIQEGNLNYGKEYEVPLKEVQFFLGIRRELDETPDGSVFNGEVCYPTGFEVCNGSIENPDDWWIEYEDCVGNLYYRR